MYKEAIIDHWEAERPEKEGAWNIFTALTGTNEFDLKEAIGYLQEHPLDLIDWAIMNSVTAKTSYLWSQISGNRLSQRYFRRMSVLYKGTMVICSDWIVPEVMGSQNIVPVIYGCFLIGWVDTWG